MVLEVALFDPIRTAATGRRLGIESDARARFERGVDPAMVLPGTEYATRLIHELCGGEAGASIVAGAAPEPPGAFKFRISKLERLAGIALEAPAITEQLRRLGFEVTATGRRRCSVTPPSWRHDVTMEADIVEELVRHHGYDRVPPMPVRRIEAVGAPTVTAAQQLRSIARRTLAQQGMVEAVTWSFIEPRLAAQFGDDRLRLRNPIHADLSVLRPSLLPNLWRGRAQPEPRPGRPCPVRGRCALLRRPAGRAGDDRGRPARRAQPWPPLGLGAASGRCFDARADALAVLTACKVKLDGVERRGRGRRTIIPVAAAG